MKPQRRITKKNYVLPLIPILLAVIFSTFFFTKQISYKNYDWTGIRTEIKDSIIRFSRAPYDALTSYNVEFTNHVPDYWYCQHFIRKNLSLQEALKLKTFPEDKIKAIAFEVTVKKNPKLLYSTMVEALNDTSTQIFYQSGCLGEEYLLAEYLNLNVFFLGLDSNFRSPIIDNIEEKLQEEQYEYIDSLYNYRVSKKWDYLSVQLD